MGEKEQSIEEIFAEFVDSIKNLSDKDIDKLYDNLKKIEEKETNDIDVK